MKYNIRFFESMYNKNKTLFENLAGFRFHSPKSLKSFLGKRGLKLRFETKFRWGIYYGKELVGFLKKEK